LIHIPALIKDLLGGINSVSRTVVMTTHNLERGLELGDRVIILDGGKVVYQAAKRDIGTKDFRQVFDRYTGIGK